MNTSLGTFRISNSYVLEKFDSKEEYFNFTEWAFGRRDKNIRYPKSMITTWNGCHGEELKFDDAQIKKID